MDNIFKINYEKNNRNKSIKISGAKNAILPLMIAKILVPGRTTFKNILNEIEDFKRIYTMLQNVGKLYKYWKRQYDVNF